MTTFTRSRAIALPRWPSYSPRTIAWQAAVGLAIAAAAAGADRFELSHSTVQTIAALIAVAGTLWCLTTRRTGLALALLMFYLGALDGYLKLSTGSNYVTLVRDVLLWSIAIGVLLRALVQRRPLPLPPLSAWVIALVAIVLAEVAHPDNGTLYHTVGGVRQHLEFVPLFFLTFVYVRTTRALRVFVLLLLVLAILNAIANIIQFHESPQQLASWGPGYAERVLGTQSFSASGRNFWTPTGQQLTRPFGLGSDAGDGGYVDAFALAAVFAVVMLRGTRRYIPLALIAAALAVAGIITAQGRAVVGCAVVVLLGYAILSVTSRRAIATVLAIGVTGIVGYVVATTVLAGTSSSSLRVASLTSSNLFSVVNHGRGSTYPLIGTYLVRYPFGAGLGVAGPASGTSGGPPQADTLNSENEFLFTIVETGFPGMIALIGFTLTVFVIGLRRCRQEPDPEARLLLAAIIAPVAGMLALYAVSAVSPTTPSGPYLWAVAGIVSYWLISKPAERRRAARDTASSLQRTAGAPRALAVAQRG
jgi:hypothetical protein